MGVRTTDGVRGAVGNIVPTLVGATELLSRKSVFKWVKLHLTGYFSRLEIVDLIEIRLASNLGGALRDSGR